MEQYPNIETIERVRRSLSPPATIEGIVVRSGLATAEVRAVLDFLTDDGIVLPVRGDCWGLL